MNGLWEQGGEHRPGSLSWGARLCFQPFGELTAVRLRAPLGGSLRGNIISRDLRTLGFIFIQRESWKQHPVAPFSLTGPGLSQISLPHLKQEVSAGSCANGLVLCGMSPIVMGTKTS